MTKYYSLLIASVGFFTPAVLHSAAITTVSFDSGDRTLINATGAGLITGGASGIDNDGAVLQLGYFDQAVANNLFLGNWVPLSGQGASVYANTTIGDKNVDGAGDGTFALSLNFELTNNIPLNNALLGIRVYNGLSIAASSHFQTISNSAWLFKTPAFPPASVNLSLNDLGLQLQSNPGVALANNSDPIRTSVAIVPEPATMSLMLVGLVSLASRRRRQVA